MLESVDLSHNDFNNVPTSALSELSTTIRSLNMSYNLIEHIDSTMFNNIPRLISLSLRENKVNKSKDKLCSLKVLTFHSGQLLFCNIKTSAFVF